MALIFFLLPLLVACGKPGSSEMAKEASSVKKEKASKGGRGSNRQVKEEEASKGEEELRDRKDDRKLIREGRLAYEVDSIEREEERIEEILEELDGYVGQQKTETEYRRRVVSATLKVPAEHFKELVERISEGAGELDDKRIEVKDVTRKFIDLEARMETKKELEARYKDLLKKSDSVEEILSIEKEIQSLREEIESIEGRLRHLKDRIALSSLEVKYYRPLERKKEEPKFHFWSKFTAAAQAGWHGLQWVLIGLTALWPLWLVLGATAFILVRAYRRRKRKRS